jgi:hypothetical protein|tara:strand:+ start:216 stop:401 length:186 start_codon:yes stop_codon:yes gene_type:complete
MSLFYYALFRYSIKDSNKVPIAAAVSTAFFLCLYYALVINLAIYVNRTLYFSIRKSQKPCF